jgi:hypothetical protein
MRAIVCSTFGAYSFEDVDELVLDDLAQIAGAALWLKEEESKGAKGSGGKRSRAR